MNHGYYDEEKNSISYFVTGSKRRASAKTWISRLAKLPHLSRRVAERLCERGILRADEDKVLLVFKRRIYPELDPKPEQELVERVRRALLGDAPDVDVRTAALVTLAASADLPKNVLSKRSLEGAQDRLNRVIYGKLTPNPQKEEKQALRAVLEVAVLMPVIGFTAAGITVGR